MSHAKALAERVGGQVGVDRPKPCDRNSCRGREVLGGRVIAGVASEADSTAEITDSWACWVVEFPARSMQEPLTEACSLSGPEYVGGATHVSTPEVASVPAKVTMSAWLYQPFES